MPSKITKPAVKKKVSTPTKIVKVVENLDAEYESPAQLKAFKAKMKAKQATQAKKDAENAAIAKKYGVRNPSSSKNSKRY